MPAAARLSGYRGIRWPEPPPWESAFFRWLSRKYPSIIVNCVEEKTSTKKRGWNDGCDLWVQWQTLQYCQTKTASLHDRWVLPAGWPSKTSSVSKRFRASKEGMEARDREKQRVRKRYWQKVAIFLRRNKRKIWQQLYYWNWVHGQSC